MSQYGFSNGLGYVATQDIYPETQSCYEIFWNLINSEHVSQLSNHFENLHTAVKFCIQSGSDTAMLCAKYQSDFLNEI